MKLIPVIFLILITYSSKAQSLQGGFLVHTKDTNYKEGYYFYENGEFIWFRFTHSVQEFGRGKITLTNDSLIINFLTARRQFDIVKDESVANLNNSCTIVVKAMYSDATPLAGLKVTLLKTNITQEADTNGIVKIELINPIGSDKIHFEKDGFVTVDQTISLSRWNHYFEIVANKRIGYKENKIEKFRWKLQGKDLMLTNRDNAQNLKLISRKKFLDLYYRVNGI